MFEIDNQILSLYKLFSDNYDKINLYLNTDFEIKLDNANNTLIDKIKSVITIEDVEKINQKFNNLKSKIDKKELLYKIEFFDKSLFILNNQTDLYLSLQYLNLHLVNGNNLHIKYFSKNVAIIGHEILLDRKNILSSEFRDLIKHFNNSETLEKIDLDLKKLNELQKKHLHFFKKIRNNLIGHRQKNGREQTRLLFEINGYEIHKIGFEVYNINQSIINNLFNILE